MKDLTEFLPRMGAKSIVEDEREEEHTDEIRHKSRDGACFSSRKTRVETWVQQLEKRLGFCSFTDSPGMSIEALGDDPFRHKGKNGGFTCGGIHHGRRLKSILKTLWKSVAGISKLGGRCRWLKLPKVANGSMSDGEKQQPASIVTGTIYGCRNGHVQLALQQDPRYYPEMLVEMPTSTKSLVKEMASGLVKIALECPISQSTSSSSSSSSRRRRIRLVQEPIWSMFCNGRRSGYAITRSCSDEDLTVFRQLQAVSMGAGVLPPPENGHGELMYMRAQFHRVVGSTDSQALYMINAGGTGASELSIFLLRV